MILRRTSQHRIVWRCETPVLQNPGEWSERGKCELRQGPTWSIQHQGSTKAESRKPQQAREVLWGRTVQDRPQHDSSCQVMFLKLSFSFSSFWLAISEAGWTSRKKAPLGVQFKSARRRETRISPRTSARGDEEKKLCRGVCAWWRAVGLMMIVNCTKTPPTPFLWHAPTSTQKPKKTKPGRAFVGARGGGLESGLTPGSQPEG